MQAENWENLYTQKLWSLKFCKLSSMKWSFFISSDSLFDARDAGFHILITSYQLLVSDEKYFRRVKWQYMVLDEAQAIKSSSRFKFD